MEKAIIIPVSPNPAYFGGPFVGKVLPHITHINKNGGVLWNCGTKIPRKCEEIRTGYFYETKRHVVTYQFEIIRFIDWSNQDELIRFIDQCACDGPRVGEAKFVPDFRLDDLIATYQEFLEGRKTAFGILIKKIYPLEKPIDVLRFVKVSDNKPIQSQSAVRATPVVYTLSEAVPLKNRIDTREFVHEHIEKVITEGALAEKDLEDLLEYVLYDADCEYLDRQVNLEDGRIDVVYRKGTNYYVIELKRQMADVNALAQIKRYMSQVSEKHKEGRLEGIIICESPTESLKEEVSKEPNIAIREFKLSIDFGLKF